MWQLDEHHAALIFWASIAWWSVEEALRLLGNPPKSRPSWNLFHSYEGAYRAYVERCLSQGQTPLIVISRDTGEPGVEKVVRWCPECGSIVADREYDERVDAGYYMKMKSPTITKEANKQ